MDNLPRALITSISVRELFGRRSYDIEVPSFGDMTQRLLLLHGDNGSGKTTILRLVWHALSAADNKGHRSFIARTPFRKLTISLAGGSALTVTKTQELVGDFEITLQRDGLVDLVTRYAVDDRLRASNTSMRRKGALLSGVDLPGLRTTIRRSGASAKELRELEARIAAVEAEQAAEQSYLTFLEEEVRTPLFLADDRSLYSDDPDINRTRELLSRREDTDKPDRLSRLVFLELQVTIRRVNDLLRGLTFGGQNDGSANSNAIYASVLRQLVNPQASVDYKDSQRVPALEQLERISHIAPGFEEFGLVPPFDAVEFAQLLTRARDSASEMGDLAERVVSPFLSSLNARYEALQEAHDLLQALVPTINEFLTEKLLRFTPRNGLTIVTMDDEPLEVESLSSGERQLLMLLCTTLLARVDTRLFIIDEPELSLGVEWQRKILDALMGLTEGTGLQFLVATHSIEIISGRPDSLVQLKPL